MAKLSAARLHPVGLGDQNVVESDHGSLEADFDAWKKGLLAILQQSRGVAVGGGDGVEKVVRYESSEDEDEGEGEDVVDMEDIGRLMAKAKTSNQKTAVKNQKSNDCESEEPPPKEDQSGENGGREMVTPALRQSLTKQGELVW